MKTPVTADNYFDAAQALYWYCTAWHGGQDSELYSIMSARLGYTPAMSECGIDQETEAMGFSAELESGEWDATEMLCAIDAAYAESHAGAAPTAARGA